ncbi:unnamed protein product [Ilex paraguariensis]|uniref:Uncharacterized protein n=1 Tax=Ilex paraguariensis TaxID=185542 RepID=A0ABC8RZB3_9AQUA
MSGFTSSTNPSSSPQFPFSPSSSPLSFPPSSSSSQFSWAFPQQPSASPFSFSNPNHSFGTPPSSAPSYGFGFASSSPPISSAFCSSEFSSALYGTTSSGFSEPYTGSPLHGATPAGAYQPLFGATFSSASSSPFRSSNSFGANSSIPILSTTSSLFGSSSNSRTTSLFGFSSSSSVSSGTTYATAPLFSALFGSSSPSWATATLASSASTTVSCTDSTVATTGCQDSIGGSSVCSTISFKLAVSDDEEGFGNEDEQVYYRALEHIGVQMPECETKKEVPGVTWDQEKRDAITMKVASLLDSIQRAEPPAIGGVVVTSSMVVSSGAALAKVPVVEASSIKMDIPDVKSAATYVRVTLHAKELEIGEVDSCENPSAATHVRVTLHAKELEIGEVDSCENPSAATHVRVTLHAKELEIGQVDSSENPSAVSELVAGYELKSPGVGSLISPISEMTDLNELTLSPHCGLIIKQISSKYGDITKGSILKSMAAKFPFLQLVAHTVHQLSNHTQDTLGSNELELIQTWTADAAAVGFQVDWLQQRVNQVTAATKYHGHRMELDELGKQIDATIKCLMEMELREIVCKEELASIKAEMEGNDFSGSILSTGLL